MNTTTEVLVHVGWQNQPDGRGTWDIVQSCVGTITLLCWSSVCPNVPSPKDTNLQRLSGKLSLFLLAILGPEFIFMVALGQLQAAREARQILRDAGFEQYGLRQCFFINMGGFHVRPLGWEISGKSSFPVDAKQMLFLVKHRFLDMPSIARDEIDDRNKADGLSRLITIVQVVWFTIGTLARVAQGLTITTMELTTLSFVFLMSATAICWWHKPMDISTPIVLDLKANMETVLSKAGDPSTRGQTSYLGTPLSFVERNEWFLSRLWFYYTEILRKLRLIPKPSSPYELDYFHSIVFHSVTLKQELVATPLIMGYGAIFLAAWNFHFPTQAEQTLWRIAAATTLVYNTAGDILAGLDHRGGFALDQARRLLRRHRVRSHSQQTIISEPGEPSNFKLLFRHFCGLFQWLRNISPDQDPALHIRLRTLIPSTILCFIYCFSRAFILLEDSLALRSLPQDCFTSVDWTRYSPFL